MWYTYPSEKYEFVSWDYSSQLFYLEKENMFQTTNQFCAIFNSYVSLPDTIPPSEIIICQSSAILSPPVCLFHLAEDGDLRARRAIERLWRIRTSSMSYHVGETISHPPVIIMFIGGMVTIPTHMAGLW